MPLKARNSCRQKCSILNAPGGAKGDIGGSQVTRRELGEASWEEGRD